MKLIETKTLATAQANIEFTDIPQDFTDLVAVISARNSTAQSVGLISFNGNTTGRTFRYLLGNGASASSGTYDGYGFTTALSSYTANTFSNNKVYIPNYTGSAHKSYSLDDVTETNATAAYMLIGAGLWSNTSAITSVTFTASSGNLVAGSTISLYGIGGVGDGVGPKATGGSISYLNGHWIHVFTSSGTFTPTEDISDAEYLVVAGGGGGSNWGGQYINGGGGGAGGFRSASAQELNLSENYTVTVGAGGATATSGSDSVFNLTTSAGGGRGGTNSNGASGGSGGGGAGAGNTPSTSPSQGNNGGANAGGGGGAGAAGSPGQSAAGGSGATSSITGSSLYYAGGGGSGSGPFSVTQGPGGAGGGGTGSASGPIGTTGTINTGGGGGGGSGSQSSGAFVSGLAGGSGIVIVRYPA